MDKREQDVLEQVRQKTEDIKVPENLEPENIRQMLEEKESAASLGKRHRRWGVRQTSVLAAACLAVVVGFAAWNVSRPEKGSNDNGSKERLEISSSKTIAQAESYEQVFEYYETYQKKLEEEQESYKMDAGDMARSMIAESADGSAMNGSSGGAKSSGEEMAIIEDAADTADATTEHSQTNVRQEGVDEADIAKTDGRYLYVLEDNEHEIAVVDTMGQSIKKVASVEVGDDRYIREFYIIPDMKKMVVICGLQSGGAILDDPFYTQGAMGDNGVTMAVTYDIQEPEKPKEEGNVTQSGNYSSSRMVNGYLYLFSEVHIWGEVVQNATGRHIGVWNCRKRIQMYYGESAVLTTSSTPGEGTQVWMELPIDKLREDAGRETRAEDIA